MITIYFANGDRVDMEGATSAERGSGAYNEAETLVVKEGGDEAAVFRFDQIIGWVVGEHGHTSGFATHHVGDSNGN